MKNQCCVIGINSNIPCWTPIIRHAHSRAFVDQINNNNNERASCFIKYHKKAFKVVEEEHTDTASVAICARLAWGFVVPCVQKANPWCVTSLVIFHNQQCFHCYHGASFHPPPPHCGLQMSGAMATVTRVTDLSWWEQLLKRLLESCRKSKCFCIIHIKLHKKNHWDKNTLHWTVKDI